MRRKHLLAFLLLAALVPLLAQEGAGEAPGARFAFRHGEAKLDAHPFLPVADARYEQLVLVRVGEEGAVDPGYEGTRAVRGLLTDGGEPVRQATFEEGRARLSGVLLARAVEVQDVDGRWYAATETPVAGWLSLLPPLAAIILAVLLREVLVALFLGVLTGVVVLEGSFFAGLMRTLDRHVVGAASDSGHMKILIFSCLIGAVVAMVTRLGGVKAMVEALARKGSSAMRAQLSTWVMGVTVFFDDYANALLVGHTMRPISDRFRVSREKLAFLVDCTAAPVACIAIISTWIAAEISYIDGWLEGTGEGIAGYAKTAAYEIFLDSIAFSFYPILALLFSFLVVVLRRDFGPMRTAEARARSTGKVIADGARPLISTEMEEAEPLDPDRLRWWNGALPILMVIGTVVVGLYLDGRPSYEAELAAARRQVEAAGSLGPQAREQAVAALRKLEEGGFLGELRQCFGRADSYNVLLWASLFGLILAWVLALGQRYMNVREAADTTVKGIKAMITACIVLMLAWSLSDLCKLVNTSGYLIHQVAFDFELLPAAVFVLSAVVGFSTGSSWGTMGILVPLTMTYAAQLGLRVGADPADLRQVLVASLGGVLAGAVFGDHCSPISDTTVMSSMATGCDHMDHVKTQLPYALSVAIVAMACGYLPAGFGLPAWQGLLLGGASVFLVVRFLGRRTDLPRAS